MKTILKKTIFISLILFLFAGSSFSQTDRAWWNSLSPEWKKVIQKQQFKGKDVTPTDEQLVEIAKMTFLELSGNKTIKSLKPAANLTLLEIVRCNGSAIESLEGLEGLMNLKDLDCSDNDNITSLLPISASYNLERLNCGNTMVKSLSPLKDLKRLTYLDVHLATVLDLRVLKGLDNLTVLNVAENASLFSLEGVNFLPNLTELNLSDTRVESLAPLETLKNLKILSFEKAPVKTLRPLQGLKTLEEINCSQTDIPSTSMDYLVGHVKIKMLRAKGIKITPNEITTATEAIMKKNPTATVIISSK